MESIVTFEDFLKTYPKKSQERIQLYFKVMRLRKRYDYGSKKIAKLLNISRYKIEGWIYQKNVPRPIKAIDILNNLGFFLPLKVSKDRGFTLFIKIFSFAFGDGGVGKDFRVYLTGNKDDLEDLKKEIDETYNLKCKIDEVISENNKIGDRIIKGKSYELDIQGEGSHILGRLLVAAGAPRGDKTNLQFLVPNWVMKGNLWVKKLFLEVLLSNEIQAPKLGSYGCHFGHACFRMVKTKEYEECHKKFLNQIRELLKEFGINTSEVKSDKARKERRDGKISQPMYFHILRNKLNLYKFYKQFSLIHSNKKQKIFDESAKCIRENLEKELVKVHHYHTAMEMRKNGLGCRRIAKNLGITGRSMIDGWLRYSQRPLYLNRKKELEKILDKSI